MTGRVLLTGAAGSIGSVLGRALPEGGWTLRLLDVAPIDGADDAADLVTADIRDADALDEAMTDVDAVVHLAAVSTEAAFPDILTFNIDGTYQVFDAARRAGVRRVVYASSNHAVGFTPRMDLAGIDLPPRPDTYYGVSKVFGEALGRLYHDRYGMAVAALRIGTFAERPTAPRHLSTWLSHGDCVRLVDACLSAPDLGFAVVYGISANTRGWWDLEPGRALGYSPQDDAEAYADEVLAAHGKVDPTSPSHRYLGGEFAGPEYDA